MSCLRAEQGVRGCCCYVRICPSECTSSATGAKDVAQGPALLIIFLTPQFSVRISSPFLFHASRNGLLVQLQFFSASPPHTHLLKALSATARSLTLFHIDSRGFVPRAPPSSQRTAGFNGHVSATGTLGYGDCTQWARECAQVHATRLTLDPLENLLRHACHRIDAGLTVSSCISRTVPTRVSCRSVGQDEQWSLSPAAIARIRANAKTPAPKAGPVISHEAGFESWLIKHTGQQPAANQRLTFGKIGKTNSTDTEPEVEADESRASDKDEEKGERFLKPGSKRSAQTEG